MTNSESILEKFSQFEISLSYEQVQDIKNGNIPKVLNEHSEYSEKLLKREKLSILSGFIFLTIGLYLVFFSNFDSLIPTIATGLGAGSLSWGISQFNRAKSYKEDIHSLKKHFNNRNIT